MVLKWVEGTELREGSNVIIDNEPCVVRSIDISKTGKHGHAKARIEAIGILDGKKRVIVKPGHEKFAVPMVEKRKGQVLSISEAGASLMDVESFETLEVAIPEELKEELKEGVQVEYWNVEGRFIIKRVITQ